MIRVEPKGIIIWILACGTVALLLLSASESTDGGLVPSPAAYATSQATPEQQAAILAANHLLILSDHMVLFADTFESGDCAAWSVEVPGP